MRKCKSRAGRAREAVRGRFARGCIRSFSRLHELSIYVFRLSIVRSHSPTAPPVTARDRIPRPRFASRASCFTVQPPTSPHFGDPQRIIHSSCSDLILDPPWRHKAYLTQLLSSLNTLKMRFSILIASFAAYSAATPIFAAGEVVESSLQKRASARYTVHITNATDNCLIAPASRMTIGDSESNNPCASTLERCSIQQFRNEGLLLQPRLRPGQAAERVLDEASLQEGHGQGRLRPGHRLHQPQQAVGPHQL